MTTRRKSRNRQSMPQDICNLFMLGSGCGRISGDEIEKLWQAYGKQFLRHLDGLDRTGSSFRQWPMIFNLLETTEEAERKRFEIS